MLDKPLTGRLHYINKGDITKERRGFMGQELDGGPQFEIFSSEKENKLSKRMMSTLW